MRPVYVTRKQDTQTHVFFYEQEFYVLSNFSAFNLRWRGRTFMTSEHAYQWDKFFDRHGHCHLTSMIEHAPSAHEAFRIARNNHHVRCFNWDNIKIRVMYQILREKVNQHEYVRQKLLETGDRRLVEDSWRDNFWGWGADEQGANMLGELWMTIRGEITGRPRINKTLEGYGLADG